MKLSFKNILKYLAFVPIILLVIVEFLNFLFTDFFILGKIGIILWLVNFLLILFFGLWAFLFLINKAINKKCVLSLLLLVVNIILISNGSFNYKNVSGETTQEIACMLNHLKNSPDWGFNQTCLFGYPARQYLVPSLPSVIAGRSVFALNFGGSIYLILGLIIFSAGLIKYFGEKIGNISSAIFLASIWHVHYIIHFTFAYEQSIFPFSLGLITSGFFMSYLEEKKLFYLPLIMFMLFVLINAYTPALAFYFLSILVLLYYLFKGEKIKQKHKLIIIIMISTTLLSLLKTFRLRYDIEIFDSNSTEINLGGDLLRGIKHLLFLTDSPNYVSPVFHFIFILTIFSGLIGLLGPKFIIFSLWMIGLYIVSLTVKGYAYYHVPFRLHRSIVGFPIFFILTTKITKIIYSEKTKSIIYLAIGVISVTSFYYFCDYFQNRGEDKNRDFAIWISEFQQNYDTKSLYVTPEVSQEFLSYYDSLLYFSPNLEIIETEIENCQLTTNFNSVLLMNKQNNCQMAFNQLSEWKYLGKLNDVIGFSWQK